MVKNKKKEGYLDVRKIIEDLKASALEIDRAYPDTFEPLMKRVEALQTNDEHDAKELKWIKKGINRIKEYGEKISAMEMRLAGASQPEVAKQYSLTRRQVMFLEEQLDEYVTKIGSADWVKKNLEQIDSYKQGYLPSNDELDLKHTKLRPSLLRLYLPRKAKSQLLMTRQNRNLIAEKLGVNPEQYISNTKKQWTEELLIAEIRKFARELGRPNLMPLQKELNEFGREDLRGAIDRFGGQSKIATLAELKYRGQKVGSDGSRTFWTDENIRNILRKVASDNGHPDTMPTQQECAAAYPDNPFIVENLIRATKESGGVRRTWLEVATLAGLKIRKGSTYVNSRYIKSFVKAIGDSLEALTPAEVYVLFEQQKINKTGHKKYANRSFDRLVDAIQSGNLPPEIIRKWANGEGSDQIDQILSKEEEFTADRFELNEPALSQKNESSHMSDEDESFEDVEQMQPTQSGLETLKALDITTELMHRVSSDEAAIKFLIAKATSKLWARCFEDERIALSEIMGFKGDEYSMKVKGKFLKEYEESRDLALPEGYDFKDSNGKAIKPKLMQRLIAYKVLTEKCVLNLSGTGTGKTLSAVLASRIIDAQLTVITCPHATINGWKNTILNAFPSSDVVTKTFNPKWNGNGPRYLVLNHEIFQDSNKDDINNFLLDNKLDFIVIDELHQVKQRNEKSETQRRRLIGILINQENKNGERPRVLGLSATPVINNLYEGKSLIELVSGEEQLNIKSDANIENCMRLYQKFTQMGFRMMPKTVLSRMPKSVEIDCSSVLSQLVDLGTKAHPQKIEAILVKKRWPAIHNALRKKTVIFTDYVMDIVPFLAESVRKAGFTVGCFTGDDKEASMLGYSDSLDEFMRGDLDILIASVRTAGTGVDGLQHVCNNVIFATLPWTATDYEQAIGRFDREGVKFDRLDIHIPKTYIQFEDGKRWSWCEAKLARIQNKRDIAKAAVDGEIPDKAAKLTPQQASKYWMKWLERLDENIN